MTHYRPGSQHPDEYRRDLNPDALEGQNTGRAGQHGGGANPLTLEDIKEAHERLPGLHDDELKQIPVLRHGQRLQQGATYIDLAAADCQEFTATAEMEATPGHWYVDKGDVDYALWNKLIGVRNPARRLEAS